MASVHPDLAFLLEGLVPTPLAPLAADAMNLISAQPEAGPFDGGGIGRGPIDPREREQVLRQVDLIEQAVFLRIKGERGYTARIRELAEGLELKRVAILAEDDDGAEHVIERRVDDLTSPQRDEAIMVFADVYAEALESVRQRWRRRR